MAKATAVRNIRDDHQKAFLKIFNSLCGRFNRWQVWQDFVMVTAIEISNATDRMLQSAPKPIRPSFPSTAMPSKINLLNCWPRSSWEWSRTPTKIF